MRTRKYLLPAPIFAIRLIHVWPIQYDALFEECREKLELVWSCVPKCDFEHNPSHMEHDNNNKEKEQEQIGSSSSSSSDHYKAVLETTVASSSSSGASSSRPQSTSGADENLPNDGSLTVDMNLSFLTSNAASEKKPNVLLILVVCTSVLVPCPSFVEVLQLIVLLLVSFNPSVINRAPWETNFKNKLCRP